MYLIYVVFVAVAEPDVVTLITDCVQNVLLCSAILL
jgi:hypothetical protein